MRMCVLVQIRYFDWPGDTRACLAVLDAIVEANRREDDAARVAANMLFHTVRGADL